MLIIGENINATIPRVREAILNRDEDFIKELALRQEEAGTGLIDINTGTGEGTAEDERESMRWAVRIVADTVKTGLCIDSDNPVVLEAGIEAAGDQAGMINSTKGSEKSLDAIMPLAAATGLPLIGLAMDGGGIPKTAQERVDITGSIIAAAAAHRVPEEKIYIDPLVMPVSTDITQGNVTLETAALIKQKYPNVKCVLAVSNVSFGLPKRAYVNSALISMAAHLGIDAILINPLHKPLRAAAIASATLLGRDRHCRKYTRAARKETI
jgi:5-methyltetrahydrofolate corrinoid/iron sulfur protein methyltransferase